MSSDTKAKIRSMIRQIGEIESIGDSCFSLARKLKHLHDNNENFSDGQTADLKQMMQLVDASLTQMNHVVAGRRENIDGKESFALENDINKKRNLLKDNNLKAMDEQLTTYSIGTSFNDIIEACEQLADYVINVVEARLSCEYLVNVEDKDLLCNHD